jgi:predicted metal-dependent phosphotriesterase family hydrolase
MLDEGKVITVAGPVPPGQLGITHSHEHIMFDYFHFMQTYDVIFTDENVAARELELYKAAGGGSIVDCTVPGLGANPAALARISHRTGVNIVLGCGWYRERIYDAEVQQKTARQLAQVLVGQIEDGFAGTSVRAGFIGEIGTERGPITPAEERVFRAAAYAQAATGVGIWTHTTHFGERALDQIDLLQECGVPASRIVISHLGDREDCSVMLQIAERGVYVSIDNIGYTGDGYPGDDVRASSVKALVDAGFLRQVVIGTDIGTRSALKAYGGRGFAWLIEQFLPRLRALGLDDAQLKAITTDNVARALTVGKG